MLNVLQTTLICPGPWSCCQVTSIHPSCHRRPTTRLRFLPARRECSLLAAAHMVIIGYWMDDRRYSRNPGCGVCDGLLLLLSRGWQRSQDLQQNASSLIAAHSDIQSHARGSFGRWCLVSLGFNVPWSSLGLGRLRDTGHIVRASSSYVPLQNRKPNRRKKCQARQAPR